MTEIKTRPGLTIDLNALCDNYRTAQRLSSGAQTACVVKADAYGLGMTHIARALSRAGAKNFFVATPEEGAELRETLRENAPQNASQTDIYILNGFLPHAGALFLSHQLRPCLASLEDISAWRALKGQKPPPALHLDTGINRFGISAQDHKKITDEIIQDISPSLVMSHLACADRLDHEMNQQQLNRFNQLRAAWTMPASLANTAGLFLGADFAFQMVRPGIGLYGGDPFEQPHHDLPFRPVIHLTSFIAQTRDIAAGESVGYGASFCAARPMRIAIIPAGYADGYARAAQGINVFIHGRPAPLIGRISMDMLAADISDLPAGITGRGQKVELLGEHITIGALARAAGTIAHNIATGLGRRLPRHYISDIAELH